MSEELIRKDKKIIFWRKLVSSDIECVNSLIANQFLKSEPLAVALGSTDSDLLKFATATGKVNDCYLHETKLFFNL